MDKTKMCKQCKHSPIRKSWSKLLDDFNLSPGGFTDVRGVEAEGPVVAARIVETFGDKAILVGALRDPLGQMTRLYSVPGGQILIDETPQATMIGIRSPEWTALEEINVSLANCLDNLEEIFGA